MILALHNLYVPIVRKKDINNSNATGDGKDYDLTAKKNYESGALRLKDLAKESPETRDNKGKTNGHKMRLFVRSFTVMDLENRFYIAIGAFTKSERQAYDRAMKLLH